jgi:hypothetical protein
MIKEAAGEYLKDSDMHRLWLLLVVVGLVFPVTGCGGDGGSGASPQPGAVLTGPIEISGTADGGTISLTVSEDGGSITSVEVTLTNLNCDGFTAGTWTMGRGGDFPVADGTIAASPSGIGQVKGRFTSSTAASGSIDLALDWYYGGGACEKLGTWNWSAEADEDGAREAPTIPEAPTPAEPPTMPTIAP